MTTQRVTRRARPDAVGAYASSRPQLAPLPSLRGVFSPRGGGSISVSSLILAEFANQKAQKAKAKRGRPSAAKSSGGVASDTDDDELDEFDDID